MKLMGVEISRSFLCIVAIPTLAAMIYFGLIASGMYVSESKFVVKSQGRSQLPSGLLSQMVQGSSGGGQNGYPVMDYMTSRDALGQLQRKFNIRDIYSSHGDFLRRYHSSYDNTFESLWRYYTKSILSVSMDEDSSVITLQVRSFGSSSAQDINKELIALSEDLVNGMNQRSLRDAESYAKYDLKEAENQEIAASEKLANYRNSNDIYDAGRQSIINLQQASIMEGRVIDLQGQLKRIQATAPQSSQIKPIQMQIDNLRKSIVDIKHAVTGGTASLSSKAVGYDTAVLNDKFAAKRVQVALTALQEARSNALQKKIYLETIVEPSHPDEAVEPKRVKSVISVFFATLLAWACFSLLMASVREHHD